MSRDLDRSDFIRAWLQKREYARAHEDLRSYHEAVYRAYCGAFGANLEQNPNDPSRDEHMLHRILDRAADSIEQIQTPFSGIMCANLQVSELYHKYSDAFTTATSTLRSHHIQLMLELVELIWRDAMPYKVSEADLHAHGMPKSAAPEPMDYW